MPQRRFAGGILKEVFSKKQSLELWRNDDSGKRSEQRNFPQLHQLRNCPFLPFLMSKVLVDHLYHHHLELLQQESQGQFDFIPVDFRTQDSQIENHLPEALAIIGRVDPSEAQYQSANELALIQTLSAGFEEVDLERAQRHSVQVANNNGANAVSVAEHAASDPIPFPPVAFPSPECEPGALGKPEDEESGNFRKNAWPDRSWANRENGRKIRDFVGDERSIL